MEMKPILFSTPMVQAILEDRKSKTRRVIPEKIVDEYYDYDEYVNAVATGVPHIRDYEDSFFKKRARYQPGDILWVRETWKPQNYQHIDGAWSCEVVFNAGGPSSRVHWQDGIEGIYERTGTWRPSIYMPREAARIFLRVTDVRAERVQDISEEDAIAEGVFPLNGSDSGYRGAFRELWNKLNAKRGFDWYSNDWVWVISFERVDKPNGWPGGEGGE